MILFFKLYSVEYLRNHKIVIQTQYSEHFLFQIHFLIYFILIILSLIAANAR